MCGGNFVYITTDITLFDILKLSTVKAKRASDNCSQFNVNITKDNPFSINGVCLLKKKIKIKLNKNVCCILIIKKCYCRYKIRLAEISDSHFHLLFHNFLSSFRTSSHQVVNEELVKTLLLEFIVV